MLLVQASSETRLFRHLDNHVFRLRNFGNAKAERVIFFSKCSKFQTLFKKEAKNGKKVFCFSDNCIWFGIVKLSLWRTKYFSSAANVLTSSPMILHVNKRDFFRLNFLGSDRWIWSRWCDGDFNSAWARLQYCLSRHPRKWDFLNSCLTTFSESVTSKIQNLWGSSFDSKCLKFNVDFKNAAKNWEKVFCFSDNYIWTDIVKLSLLRTGYFSSVANVLTSSPKIWHVNKRDFFQLNWLGSDQWIW